MNENEKIQTALLKINDVLYNERLTIKQTIVTLSAAMFELLDNHIQKFPDEEQEIIYKILVANQTLISSLKDRSKK